jgi:hypothetical protein
MHSLSQAAVVEGLETVVVEVVLVDLGCFPQHH